jgi:hypothetical protein
MSQTVAGLARPAREMIVRLWEAVNRQAAFYEIPHTVALRLNLSHDADYFSVNFDIIIWYNKIDVI